MKKIILLIYILNIVSHFSFSQRRYNNDYIYLNGFVSKYNFRLSYSLTKDRVTLFRRGMKISFRPGTDVVLINSKVFQLPLVVRKVRGNILIPKKLVTYINKSSETNLAIQPFNPQDTEIRNYQPENFRNRNNGKFVIILDPGHGGKDPGCINKKYRIYEKNIVLPIAIYTYRYLRKMLKNVKIILTRRKDKYLNLKTRANIANGKINGRTKGIFVSFHVNYSIFNKYSTGFETYYYSPISYRNKKEKSILNYRLQNISKIYYNGSLHGHNLKIASRMLDIKLAKSSKLLAKTVQRSISRNLPYRTKSRGIKQDRFFVLAHTVMPSILLELGFLSNRREAKRLSRKRNQKHLARGIAKGIFNFLRSCQNN